MHRWHEERLLMRRRSREHAQDRRSLGYMRKSTPHGCGNPRCGLCHFGKICDRGHRQRDDSRAIRHEWAATGGW